MSSITELLNDMNSADKSSFSNFVIGTVTENNDNKFPAMAKVEFTSWADGKNISRWLPMLFSYAGKKHGSYILPEIGDIVLVGFIGKHFETPFILGSFFPQDSEIPKDQFHKDNYNIQLRTKSDIKFNVIDEPDKQQINFETPKGITAACDEKEETFKISDKSGKNIINMELKKGETSIEAEKKISIKAGKCEITMDGNSGTITIKADTIKIEAGQTLDMKSTNMFKAKGGMVEVAGDQKLTLKGSAMCEISGGMVKIN